jgi:hypothetical protein
MIRVRFAMTIYAGSMLPVDHLVAASISKRGASKLHKCLHCTMNKGEIRIRAQWCSTLHNDLK